jgi:hypothetical protein
MVRAVHEDVRSYADDAGVLVLDSWFAEREGFQKDVCVLA